MANKFLTRMDELEKLSAMPPGQAVVYYRGYVARDRVKGGDGLHRFEVAVLAKYALKLFQQGHCILTQRRYGEYDYEYLAIASAPRHKAVLERPQAMRYGH